MLRVRETFPPDVQVRSSMSGSSRAHFADLADGRARHRPRDTKSVIDLLDCARRPYAKPILQRPPGGLRIYRATVQRNLHLATA